MEIIGTVNQKLDIQTGVSKAGKEWKKQTIVLDTNAEYNPLVAVSFFGDDKVAMVDGFAKGTDVRVGVNVSSREFKGNWYNSIDGWRIDEVSAVSKPEVQEDESGDLPF